MIEKDLYDVKGIYLSPYKWSATERRLLKVESEKYKPFRAFELNYSKWATYNINKFEDLTILGTFGENAFWHRKGDYKVKLSGDSHLEEAQDTMYENWCGNLEVRKQFIDCMEKDEYFELEAFLENEDDFTITVQSDIQFNIPRADYPKLKEMFNGYNKGK